MSTAAKVEILGHDNRPPVVRPPSALDPAENLMLTYPEVASRLSFAGDMAARASAAMTLQDVEQAAGAVALLLDAIRPLADLLAQVPVREPLSVDAVQARRQPMPAYNPLVAREGQPVQVGKPLDRGRPVVVASEDLIDTLRHRRKTTGIGLTPQELRLWEELEVSVPGIVAKLLNHHAPNEALPTWQEAERASLSRDLRLLQKQRQMRPGTPAPAPPES